MRRSVKILLVLSVFVVLVVAGAILFTLPHWLIRVGYGKAQGQGEAVYEVSVFRSTSGDILFLIPGDSFEDCYVFDSTSNELTIPSCPSQIRSFGMVAFSNESPIPGVLSSDKVKVETDMNVVISDSSIEFTTLSGYRVSAKRNGY